MEQDRCGQTGLVWRLGHGLLMRLANPSMPAVNLLHVIGWDRACVHEHPSDQQGRAEFTGDDPCSMGGKRPPHRRKPSGIRRNGSALQHSGSWQGRACASDAHPIEVIIAAPEVDVFVGDKWTGLGDMPIDGGEAFSIRLRPVQAIVRPLKINEIPGHEGT